MPNLATIFKTTLQVTLVVVIASLLSLYMNKGSYFANNFILGKLTIVESQENMGDIYSQGLYSEKKDIDKAIEWYGDPLLYWDNYRDTYSKKEIKTILNMFDKMATLLIHRSAENDINTVLVLYRSIAKSGDISKKGLKFLSDRRDQEKFKQKRVKAPIQVTPVNMPTIEDPMMEINNQRREYVSTLANHIKTNWLYKGSQKGWSCDMYILQNKKGEVKSSHIQLCQVTNKSKLKSFKKSLEKAIYKSSPLPLPDNEEIFEREILIKFIVTQ